MIRYPNIIGKTDAQKLEQIRSYLHQLADELNFQLDKTSSTISNYVSSVDASAKPVEKNDSVSNFNDIKALIIKSADIVKAYYAAITKLIDENNLYVAESDFGTFKEETENTLYADGTGLTHQVSSIQTIFDEDGNILDSRICDGHINSGILYYDEDANAVIGLEIGQRNMDANGNTTFNQFARFTAKELVFYDGNGVESAYIRDRRLYIPEAHITTQLTMGHFVQIVKANGGIITKYVKGVSK